MSDQFIIWQNEGKRVQDEAGVFYDFNSDQFNVSVKSKFDTLKRYANDKNGITWFDSKQKLIVIKKSFTVIFEDAIFRCKKT